MDGRGVWEAHFAGIEKEYCQIEKLANLDQIPRPTGFKVSCLPVKVQGASAGCVPRCGLRVTDRRSEPDAFKLHSPLRLLCSNLLRASWRASEMLLWAAW